MDKHLDGDLLSDYAEGLLDGPARAAADAHLAGCAECRRELAAAQAYFKGMADLEPARAPADFLAKVHARLPRPSPWKRAWAMAFGAVRAVPAPIALAVILGTGALTVYVLQGVPNDRTVVATSTYPAAQEDTAQVRQKLADVERNAPEPATHSLSAPPSGSRSLKKAKPVLREAGKQVAAADAEREAPAAPAPAAPAAQPSEGRAARAEEPAAPPKAEAAQGAGAASKPMAGIAANEAPAPASKDAESFEKPDRKTASRAAAPAAAPARPASTPGFVKEDDLPTVGFSLPLRARKDTADLVAGLKAMGIAVKPDSVPRARPMERFFRLSVPASMRASVEPYLARYGRPAGSIPPEEGAAPITLRLLLILPPR